MGNASLSAIDVCLKVALEKDAGDGILFSTQRHRVLVKHQPLRYMGCELVVFLSLSLFFFSFSLL